MEVIVLVGDHPDSALPETELQSILHMDCEDVFIPKIMAHEVVTCADQEKSDSSK